MSNVELGPGGRLLTEHPDWDKDPRPLGRHVTGRPAQPLITAAMDDGRLVNVDATGATRTQWKVTVPSRHLDYEIAQYALAQHKDGDPEPGIFSTGDPVRDVGSERVLPSPVTWIAAAEVPDPDKGA